VSSLRKAVSGPPFKSTWRVYSYLVVYDPASTPLTVIAVLHGARDVAQILKEINLDTRAGRRAQRARGFIEQMPSAFSAWP
jgi:hypothetical protein